MKKLLGGFALASAMSVPLSACGPEDGKTAVDRAEVHKRGVEKSAVSRENRKNGFWLEPTTSAVVRGTRSRSFTPGLPALHLER